jgi:hypothetical protein
MAKTFLEIRRDIAIEQAPTDIGRVIELLDKAIADLSADPRMTNFKAICDLSRAAGKLEALKFHLTTE